MKDAQKAGLKNDLQAVRLTLDAVLAQLKVPPPPVVVPKQGGAMSIAAGLSPLLQALEKSTKNTERLVVVVQKLLDAL